MLSHLKMFDKTGGSIRASQRDGLSTLYRLTNEQFLTVTADRYTMYTHILETCLWSFQLNLSLLDAGILILVQQGRLMMFLVPRVTLRSLSCLFLSWSLKYFFTWFPYHLFLIKGSNSTCDSFFYQIKQKVSFYHKSSRFEYIGKWLIMLTVKNILLLKILGQILH